MSDRSLQSQALENQIYARRDRALAQQAEMAMRAPDMIHGQIRAQENHDLNQKLAIEQHDLNQTLAIEQLEIQKAMSAEKLALSELQRQQAFEELQWARELHNTDMLALQKRGLEAEVAMKEFQMKELITAQGQKRIQAHLLNNPHIMRYVLRSGQKIGSVDSRGQVRLEEITDPDELAEAHRYADMMDASMMANLMGRDRRQETPAEALSRMVNTARTPQHQVNDLRRALTSLEKAKPTPDWVNGESAESPEFQARVKEWESQVKDLKDRLKNAQARADAIRKLAEEASGLDGLLTGTGSGGMPNDPSGIGGVLPNSGQPSNFSQGQDMDALMRALDQKLDAKLGALDDLIRNTDR